MLFSLELLNSKTTYALVLVVGNIDDAVLVDTHTEGAVEQCNLGTTVLIAALAGLTDHGTNLAGRCHLADAVVVSVGDIHVVVLIEDELTRLAEHCRSSVTVDVTGLTADTCNESVGTSLDVVAVDAVVVSVSQVKNLGVLG